jgi:hypothetical protein
MATKINRRSFVKGTLLSSSGLALALESRGQGQAPSPSLPPSSQNALPKGKIGKLEISRLILGGNLLTHYTHSRDLKYVYTLAARYNSDEKILETLALAEANGINTLSMHNPPHPMSVLRRYRKERGGKIQWIICPTAPVEPGLAKYRQQVEELIKDGCEAIYLWGVHSDGLVAGGKMDLVAAAVDVAREMGVPSGVGAHQLSVVQACEQHGVKADFYIKTFHHQSYPSAKMDYDCTWCSQPEEVARFMQTVKKPWIAFKTMAAGAIPPKQAFRYALRHGADFVLAGMFDFEIAEDVQILKSTLTDLSDRTRPWLA